jgi:hypothetical protein
VEIYLVKYMCVRALHVEILLFNVDQQRDLQGQTPNKTSNVSTALTLSCGCVTAVDVENNKFYIFGSGISSLM